MNVSKLGLFATSYFIEIKGGARYDAVASHELFGRLLKEEGAAVFYCDHLTPPVPYSPRVPKGETKPVVRRAPAVRQPLDAGSRLHLREAIAAINNAKEEFGDDLVLEIKEDRLTAMLMMVL